jgi:hypothetical protein
MKRIAGETWQFDDEDDFSSGCDAGPLILKRAEEEAAADNLGWFFEKAYANFKAGTASASFTSYVTPEYQGFLLAISATKDAAGRWSCAVTKKVTSEGAKP